MRIAIAFLVYIAVAFTAYNIASAIGHSFEAGWYGGIAAFLMFRIVDVLWLDRWAWNAR